MNISTTVTEVQVWGMALQAKQAQDGANVRGSADAPVHLCFEK